MPRRRPRASAAVCCSNPSAVQAVPLADAADVLSVADRLRGIAGADVGLVCDPYDLAEDGGDRDEVVAQHASSVTHVQVADAPGRGEPGNGRLELDRHLSALERAGYCGWVSLEYRPTTALDSLDWLDRDRRGMNPSPRRSTS